MRPKQEAMPEVSGASSTILAQRIENHSGAQAYTDGATTSLMSWIEGWIKGCRKCSVRLSKVLDEKLMDSIEIRHHRYLLLLLKRPCVCLEAGYRHPGSSNFAIFSYKASQKNSPHKLPEVPIPKPQTLNPDPEVAWVSVGIEGLVAHNGTSQEKKKKKQNMKRHLRGILRGSNPKP